MNAVPLTDGQIYKISSPNLSRQKQSGKRSWNKNSSSDPKKIERIEEGRTFF
jgi:hypothetical protein